MKAFAATISLVVLFFSTAAGESLLVGTWNVQNYLLQNRYLYGKYRFNYPKPEVQKEGLRLLLLDSRPQILFLQEVGSHAFLHELQRVLAAEGLEYPYQHFSIIPGNRSGLAVLSRIPFRKALFHDQIPVVQDNGPLFLRRGIQEITISLDGFDVTFFHLHLKSRYSTNPDDPSAAGHRAAEITALSRFLDAFGPLLENSSPLIVGDFNTPFASPLLDPLKISWIPVPAPDPDGALWTYTYWKTKSSERLDGFWKSRIGKPFASLSARTCPAPIPPPSDHRLVLLSLNPSAPHP